MWFYVVVALVVIVGSGVYFKRKLDAEEKEGGDLFAALGAQQQQQEKASSKFVPKEMLDWKMWQAYQDQKEKETVAYGAEEAIPEEEKKELRKVRRCEGV
jgi:uncharacterized protein YxeA